MSEEHIAFIFMVEEYALQRKQLEAGSKQSLPQDEGDVFLRNIG
jgi:hypothetical protein